MGLTVLVDNHIEEYFDASMASYGVKVSSLNIFVVSDGPTMNEENSFMFLHPALYTKMLM
jgi:hypothetical protein